MEINNRRLEEGRGFFGLADFLPACCTFFWGKKGPQVVSAVIIMLHAISGKPEK